jgi:type IV pilus assembly protein PilA
MPKSNQGFTLIELMIVVAIIGILASLAVASYQTYAIRAQVAEGMSLASGTKVPIADAYTNDGVAPADRAAAGMTANAVDTSGKFVSGVEITDGRVDITFSGPDAHIQIVGRTLSLTPYITAGNTFMWRCGLAAAPAGASQLNGGAAHLAPTVDGRYLPSVCRN